jgi:hypothetical protein
MKSLVSEKVCSTCNISKPISDFREGHNQCKDCRYERQKQTYSSDRVCSTCHIFKTKDQFSDGSHCCKQCKIAYENVRIAKIKSNPVSNRQRLDQNNELASKRYSERDERFNSTPIEDCYEEYLGILRKNANSRATKAEIACDIDLPFLVDLYNKQNGKCMVGIQKTMLDLYCW